MICCSDTWREQQPKEKRRSSGISNSIVQWYKNLISSSEILFLFKVWVFTRFVFFTSRCRLLKILHIIFCIFKVTAVNPLRGRLTRKSLIFLWDLHWCRHKGIKNLKTDTATLTLLLQSGYSATTNLTEEEWIKERMNKWKEEEL